MSRFFPGFNEKAAHAAPSRGLASAATGGGPGSADAAALFEQGQFAAAAELYTVVVATDPEDVPALLGLGSSLAALRRFDAAEQELRRALRIAPALPEVHLQLGTVLFKRGLYAPAVAELRRTVELDPRLAAAYLVLGEALNQMADSDAAIEALEQAVRIQPDNSRPFYAMGIAFDRKGMPDRAAEMYRRSRETARQ